MVQLQTRIELWDDIVVCTAVASSAAEKDAEERVIRVATPGNYAPFIMYDEATQEWSGFEIELWHMIGEKSGCRIQFVRLDNPATFAELDLGRVDTMGIDGEFVINPTMEQLQNADETGQHIPITIIAKAFCEA